MVGETPEVEPAAGSPLSPFELDGGDVKTGSLCSRPDALLFGSFDGAAMQQQQEEEEEKEEEMHSALVNVATNPNSLTDHLCCRVFTPSPAPC